MNPAPIDFTMPVRQPHSFTTQKIDIDCQMMPSNNGQVLRRVSVINYRSKTISNTFVRGTETINLIRTDEIYSGIVWKELDPQNSGQPVLEVRAQLVELLRDHTAIGRDVDVQKDLKYILKDLQSLIRRVPGGGGRPIPIKFKVMRTVTKRYRQHATSGANQGIASGARR